MGSSPSTPKQPDPALEEEKAKKKALALSQAYEAKTAALGVGSTKLLGSDRNTQEIKQEQQTPEEMIKVAVLKNSNPSSLVWVTKELGADIAAGEKNTALTGFDTYVPESTDSETAEGTYDKASRNERNQNAALLEYTRRKREPQALVLT